VLPVTNEDRARLGMYVVDGLPGVSVPWLPVAATLLVVPLWPEARQESEKPPPANR
jgi:hypothetical protein